MYVQESKLPEILAAKARKVAETVRNAVHLTPTSFQPKQKSAAAVFASLQNPGSSGALHTDWLHQACDNGNNAAFVRMHEELTQLNALYARALAQAADLMHARRLGVISDAAAAAIHAVEGSVAAETMAAMETLNNLEPVQSPVDAKYVASLHFRVF